MAANTVLYRDIDEHDIVCYGEYLSAPSQSHNREADVEAQRVSL